MRGVRGTLAALVFTVLACGGSESLTSTTPGGGGGGGGGGDICSGTTNAITVSDNQFSPSCTKVAVGTTVTWTWTGSNPHTVTGSGFSSGTAQTSGTFSKQFTAAGTFNYSCTVHPGMTGSVVVQ